MCFRVKATQNDGEGHIWGKFCWLGDSKMIYNKSVVFSVKISDEVANTIRLWSWQSHACFSMLVAGNFAGYWFTSALQCHIRHTPLTDIHLPWEAEDSIAGWESQSHRVHETHEGSRSGAFHPHIWATEPANRRHNRRGMRMRTDIRHYEAEAGISNVSMRNVLQ